MFIPTSDTLTQVQRAFLDQFELGIVAVGRDAWSLMSILTTIEIAIFGLWWALSGSDAASAAFRKILTLGFFVFVISNYSQLLQVTIAGFAHTAETAAGVRVASIDDPSAIIRAGFSATLPALELARKKMGFSPTAMIDALIVTVSAFGIFFAYCTLAIQVFITRIEFGLVSTLGLILIPFGVFKPTAFIAEKTFGAIIGFGVKLMVLAFIISVAWPILSRWALPDDPDWGHLLNMLAATIAIAVLAFHAPSVASAMLWGAPSLGTSHVKGVARTAASPLATAFQAGLARGVPGAVIGGGIALGSGVWEVTKNFVSGERSAGVSLREAGQSGVNSGPEGARGQRSGSADSRGQPSGVGPVESRERAEEAEASGRSVGQSQNSGIRPSAESSTEGGASGDEVPSLKVRIASGANSYSGSQEEKGAGEVEPSGGQGEVSSGQVWEEVADVKQATKNEIIGSEAEGAAEPQLEESRLENSERITEQASLLADEAKEGEEK